MHKIKASSNLSDGFEASAPRMLTRRELQVMALVAQGFTNAQIAGELGITLGTVKWHLAGIYRKLKVRNRMQAALRLHHFNRLP